MEGTLEGLRALAVSSACSSGAISRPAATLTLDVASVMVVPAGAGLLLNLNVAGPPGGEIGRLRWCGRRCVRYIDPIRQTLDNLAPHLLAGCRRGVFESGVGPAGRLTGPPMWPRSMRWCRPTPCSPNCSGGKRG